MLDSCTGEDMHVSVATLLCRSHSGKARSVYKLQAFLELAVGDKRLRAAQELANARITYL